MTRKDLFKLINKIYPDAIVYNIGEKTGACEEKYIVIKYEQQFKNSTQIAAGGWQYIHLFCYAPIGDYDGLDEMAATIYKKLKGYKNIELTGSISPEFLEVATVGDVGAINGIGRRIELRIPKEV